MTPHELALECKRVIEDECGVSKICLVIPGPPPRGERIRIDRSSRKKCPMGEVVSWTERGTVAYFDAIDVLAWLAAQGLVEVQTSVREETDDTNPWCACGNRLSSCIGTRRGCRHTSPRCRSITGAVNDDYCDWCRREQDLLAKLEEMSR